MKKKFRSLDWLGCSALLIVFASPVAAQDGSVLFRQLCASCHDAGTERGPSRESLRAKSAEEILATLESGTMLSIVAARTGAERRAVANSPPARRSFNRSARHRRRNRCVVSTPADSATRSPGRVGTDGASTPRTPGIRTVRWRGSARRTLHA